MEMKIIPANGGGPEMDGVFLSGYGDGDYTPRPRSRSGPLPSLSIIHQVNHAKLHQQIRTLSLLTESKNKRKNEMKLLQNKPKRTTPKQTK